LAEDQRKPDGGGRPVLHGCTPPYGARISGLAVIICFGEGKCEMKIIEDGRAPNPRRVRIFLAEKGVCIPFEQIDIMKGEHRTPEFTALNTTQRVPVLVLDDGTAISETMAICRYFELMHPEPPLFGRAPMEIVHIEMWNRRAEFELLFPIAQVVRHGVPAMAPLEAPQCPDWAEANRPRVAASLARFDAELCQRPFIAGDTYSVADIAALTAIDFLRLARMKRPDELTGLNQWYERVSARPSAKA
jgi:glutathione S-transferase